MSKIPVVTPSQTYQHHSTSTKQKAGGQGLTIITWYVCIVRHHAGFILHSFISERLSTDRVIPSSLSITHLSSAFLPGTGGSSNIYIVQNQNNKSTLWHAVLHIAHPCIAMYHFSFEHKHETITNTWTTVPTNWNVQRSVKYPCEDYFTIDTSHKSVQSHRLNRRHAITGIAKSFEK